MYSAIMRRMDIDTRLNDIDDCLYRVALRALIIKDDKVLLVKESEAWWAFPGGGVDHGETIESTLAREIEEELGVPAGEVNSDLQIAYYNIGNVVNGVPRMNLFFKVSIPEQLLVKTSHVVDSGWFTKEEFMKLDLHSSYNKDKLAAVIFSN